LNSTSSRCRVFARLDSATEERGKNVMKNQIAVVAVVVAAIGILPACATKSFVKKDVAEVNSKVEALSKTVDETRDKTRVMDGRISEVDQTAQTATAAAKKAQVSANDASVKADAATKKAEAVEQASRRLMYTVVLTDAEGNFAFNKVELPDAAKAKLDELIAKVKADPQGAFFEIEGHTDATGDKVYNQQLGLQRAEVVKRYLYEQHQIPLHRMNVISYGADKPVAPNTNKDGRAQNRRVVIRVLA
jgi:outer membrane protein OmpA-like peptidoglycan-associated protein